MSEKKLEQRKNRMQAVRQLSIAASECANAAMFAATFDCNGGGDLDTMLYAMEEIKRARRSLELACWSLENGASDDAFYGGQPDECITKRSITRPADMVPGGAGR